MRHLRLSSLLAASLLAVIVPLAAQEAAPAFGIIAGEVRDRDTGRPAVGVRVAVLGSETVATTADDGRYTVAGLAAGKTTVSFVGGGFIPLTVNDVEVETGKVRELSVNLIADLIELEEFVVSAEAPAAGGEAGLLVVRSLAIEFSDAIGRDLIDRAAVSTAAAALRFVVGTSVSEGKYAVVRGLADRYTSTVLDGLPVPSADPDKRAVQVDLFPARMIENLNVSKTFTPEQAGDATGGRVDIVTRGLPEEDFLEVSLGVGFAPGTTGNDRFPTYEGGGVASLPRGGNVGGRGLPVGVDRLPSGPYSRTFSTLEQARAYDAVTRSFAPVMGTRRDAPPPGTSLAVAGGRVFALGETNRAGVMAAFSRRQEYDFQEGNLRRRYNLPAVGAPLDLRRDWTEDRGIDEVLWNLLAVGGLDLGDSTTLKVLGFYNMAAEDEARYAEQRDDSLGYFQNQALIYQQRQLAGGRLSGEHRFPGLGGLVLDWTLGGTRAAQYQPDTRFFLNSFNPVTNQAFLAGQFDGEATQRIFRDVEDDARLGAINARFDLPFPGDRRLTVQAGFLSDATDRSYAQRIFTHRIGFTGYPARIGTASPLWTDSFYAPSNVGLIDSNDRRSMQWFLYELAGRNAPDYAGEQEIEASYLSVELPIFPSLVLSGGLRSESTYLASTMSSSDGTINRVEQTPEGGFFVFFGAPQASGDTRIDETRNLPAVSLKWEPRPGLVARASWSETLARPTFKELVPVITRNDAADVGFVGNPALRISSARNLDLRLEWFPAEEEVLAVSAFSKTITDPIERISFNQALEDFETVINYPEGEVIGVEVEARKRLGFVPLPGGLGRMLLLGANFTKLESEVVVPGNQRIPGLLGETRRLFNQPAYLANVNLSVDTDSGWSGGVFYTLTGDVVVSGAASTEAGISPGLVDKPVGTLDVTIRKRWGRLNVTLSAKNLLDPAVERVYDLPSQDLYARYHRGRVFSLSGGFSF